VAKIPKFKSEKEEAEFWDSHSIADVWGELEEADIKPAPELKASIKERSQNRLKMVSLRLREEQIQAVKAIAAEKDIPYQTLLRFWIGQAIRAEQPANSL